MWPFKRLTLTPPTYEGMLINRAAMDRMDAMTSRMGDLLLSLSVERAELDGRKLVTRDDVDAVAERAAILSFASGNASRPDT